MYYLKICSSIIIRRVNLCFYFIKLSTFQDLKFKLWERLSHLPTASGVITIDGILLALEKDWWTISILHSYVLPGTTPVLKVIENEVEPEEASPSVKVLYNVAAMSLTHVTWYSLLGR